MDTNIWSNTDSFNSSSDSQTQGFIELEPKHLCYIDEETSRSLELLENNVDSSNRKHSLMGYLNTNTSTTTGTRLLREGIIRPLCHLETLEHRLDLIEYLVNRVDTLSNISNAIKRYGQSIDLDAVVPVLVNLFKARSSTLQMAEKRLDALTTIDSLVSQVSVLVGALEEADQTALRVYKSGLEDPAYLEILDDIHNVIEPEVRTGRGKRCKMFVIRQGVEPLFDIARSTYNAAINDLEEYVRGLHKEDGLAWKLSYGETRGYYLTLSLDHAARNITLNPRYIRVTKNRTMITCTTRDLMQSNVRANVSYENSMKLANEILAGALAAIMNNIGAIHKLVDIVGMLDLVTSFAKLVTSSNGTLVRPKFTTSETIIVRGRHPVLESVLKLNNLPVVSNDLVLNVGTKNFMLITGPNMGGKSIFLKQVALIQIMAQLGCFVPAESAHIKLMNRIVARSGTSDDNESNFSSFMAEMRGISTAFQEDRSSPNQSALYVIDEVGRGTSIDDGASYSFAIAEDLASRRHCFTVFATHFDQVFSLTSLYGNIIPYHFRYEEERSVDGGRSRLKISHCLAPGLTEKSHYGIRLAQACGFQDEILQMAKKDLGLQS